MKGAIASKVKIGLGSEKANNQNVSVVVKEA